MSSIFLSHNSIDKPFVEKLSKDLKRLGINVWFDKWEIKPGESLLWRINDGITENEYLGIVLTPESVSSEWVKLELDAANIKQLNSKKVVILPILLRDCKIPVVLAGKKYADFRADYNIGLSELATVFGISNTETISEDNWRKFIGNKYSNWKIFKEKEFETLVTTLATRAREFNWSIYTGCSNSFALALSARWGFGADSFPKSIPIKLCGRTNAYMLSQKYSYNPNHLVAADYTIHIGNTVNACEEYVWRQMKTLEDQYGRPIERPFVYTYRFLKEEDRNELFKDVIRTMHWDKNTPI